jgi:hypothetical protein
VNVSPNVSKLFKHMAMVGQTFKSFLNMRQYLAKLLKVSLNIRRCLAKPLKVF